MSFKRKILEVYWAPHLPDDEFNWNILYETPKSLSSFLSHNINKNIKNENNIFLCPAVRDLADNTFIVTNPLLSEFKFDESKNIKIISKTHLKSRLFRDPIFKGTKLLEYGLPFIFFCPETLEMTLTSPYFSNSPHIKYGSVIPGKFNIAKWFRPINLEYNVWKGDYIKFEEKEHLVYINFNTDKQVVLKRFNPTPELVKLSRACSGSTFWEKKVPLLKRYNRFINSESDKIILKLIKQNLCSEL
jgi:hypothetical protein|tara:strand:- start:434 stop:1168 length:735 start_codon:yes stop_codon:yes gene_type:complete